MPSRRTSRGWTDGVETTLATVAGPNLPTGAYLHLRLRAFGTGTTTLQGKVWLDGATEPVNPTLTITDTTAALQNPGTAGLYTFLSSSATNAPVVASYDDFLGRPVRRTLMAASSLGRGNPHTTTDRAGEQPARSVVAAAPPEAAMDR